MSGFSADWLALREPADHAARNAGLLAKVAAHFSGRDHLAIVDLGSGAGSNLRGVALSLPVARQSWTLVDHDPALLAAARARLSAWADRATEQGEELVIEKGGKTIAVDFRQADLVADVGRVLDWRPDLVTAAALFDLVSRDWIVRFVAALGARKTPFYTALTYDGREEWTPPHHLDAPVHRAFLSHQRRDKGFGLSAGPAATDALGEEFQGAGYRVETGGSPWILTSADHTLAGQLIDGIAGAAAETGAVSAAEAREWASFRRRAAARPEARGLIGHMDVWAVSS